MIIFMYHLLSHFAAYKCTKMKMSVSKIFNPTQGNIDETCQLKLNTQELKYTGYEETQLNEIANQISNHK